MLSPLLVIMSNHCNNYTFSSTDSPLFLGAGSAMVENEQLSTPGTETIPAVPPNKQG